MKKTPLSAFFIAILCSGIGNIQAQVKDPLTGSWVTFDDETNQPAAVVLISEKNGLFSGVITKLLDPTAPQICEKCSDYRKGKPVLGMEILSGLSKSADSYSGGQILDPDNGELYKVAIKLTEQGNKLDLRAYIGFPLLGRTQTWVKEK